MIPYNNITESFEIAACKDGRSFRSYDKFNLINGASRTYHFVIANDVQVELLRLGLSASASEELEINYYVDPIVSGGNPETTFNRNTASSNTAKSSIFSEPTVTSKGTQIDQTVIYGVAGQGNQGGQGGETIGDRYAILDSGKEILIEIVNRGSASDILNKIFFLETDNG